MTNSEFQKLGEAISLQMAQKYADAKIHYEEILKEFPHSVIALNNLAILSDDEIKENLLLKALLIDPKNFDANVNLANYYYERGDQDKSIAYFVNSLEKNPNRADIYLKLGDAYFGK